MCGIVGTVQLTGRDSRDAFRSEAQGWLSQCDRLLFHRGPDSGGTVIEDSVALGARRLRIHDLSSAADQPFETADHSIAIILNGAIFNFRDLKRELEIAGHVFRTSSDTEVIAEGYAAWGEAVFARLTGMFAITIFDRKRQRILIARDRLGIKPLYIHRGRDFWAFSSEIKPLLAHPKIPKEMNREAIPEQLAFQFLKPPLTLFKGIDVFLPGRYAVIDLSTGQTSETVYWQLDQTIVNHPDAMDLQSALDISLKQCWDADRTAGVQLSGGVDSSLICLISDQRLRITGYPTFSVLFDDNSARYYLPRSEEAYIQRIASQCALENDSWTFDAPTVRAALPEAIWYHEQPLYGASTSLYMLLAKKIRDRATVLLTGEGADDIFLGYFPDWDFSDSVETLFKFFIGKPVMERLVGQSGIDNAISSRLDLVSSPRLASMTPRQRASVATIETVLHGLLARHDRMFMSQSIEGRPPFCSGELILARFAMDESAVHDGKNGKLALKQMLETYTDHDFAFRKKIGFSAPFGDLCSDPNWCNGYVDRINLDLM